MSDPRPKTIIVDLDGTVFLHPGELGKIWAGAQMPHPDQLLPGVAPRFREWEVKGCHIVILTGRKESMREATINQLRYFCLPFDQLVMNVTGGVRVLINDLKPNGSETAFAVNVPRNEGLAGLEL